MRFFGNPYFTAGFILCILSAGLIFFYFQDAYLWQLEEGVFLFLDGILTLIGFISLFIGFKQVYGQEVETEMEQKIDS